jgi:hypothetical protein
VGLVWALFALDALAVVITYARLPVEDLYHVSERGLAAGVSRALVFSNFPLAFAAIAIIWLSVAVLTDPASGGGSNRWLFPVAIAGTAFCLFAALPGVVDQGDLDARTVNLVPAAGVAIAIVLSILAMRAETSRARLEWTIRDKVGLAIMALLLVISLPWILADFGVYIDDVPILGRAFFASLVPEGETLAAVHLGHHHGLDGFLFVTSALALGRALRTLSRRPLTSAIGAYLAFMFGYGLANLANDAWLEQVVKRGWAEYRIPSFLRPELSSAWLLLIAGVVVIWFAMFHVENGQPDRTLAATQLNGVTPRCGPK